jgi:hypothetical protein
LYNRRSDVRRRSIEKRWTPPLAHVRQERELRDHERLAVDVRKGTLEAAFCIAKDTQFGALAGKTLGGSNIVIAGNAHEQQYPGTDPPDLLAAHAHARSRHALEHDTQRR